MDKQQPAPKLSWGRYIPGELLKKWPPDPNGEPVCPAFLTHCTSVSMEDELLINMLDAYGIPAIRQFPENGQLGRVVLGMSGNGTDIYVPETMLEDARAIITGDVQDDNE